MKTAATTVSITAGALILAGISHGDELFATLTVGVDFLSHAVSKMPLGFLWCLLALVTGMALTGVLRRLIPEPPVAHKGKMHIRLAFIELAAMAAAFFVAYLQVSTVVGAIAGIVAASLVSVSYRALASLLSALSRRVTLG